MNQTFSRKDLVNFLSRASRLRRSARDGGLDETWDTAILKGVHRAQVIDGDVASI